MITIILIYNKNYKVNFLLTQKKQLIYTFQHKKNYQNKPEYWAAPYYKLLNDGIYKHENMKLFTPIDPKKTAKTFCTFVDVVDLKNKFWNLSLILC